MPDTQLKILIVEDEVIIAEDMKQMLEKLGYNVIGIAFDYNEAIDVLNEKKPDLALIDINLGGTKDGIDLADFINKNYSIPLIFATSNVDPLTLAKVKRTISHGYLLKPFTPDDLYTSIEIGIGNFHNNKTENQKPKDSIFIKQQELYIKININDIFWLKSDRNYTEINTINKMYLVRGTVKDTLDELDQRFIRIHKTFVVNIEKIDALGPNYIIINKQELPIGKIYKEELMSKIRTLK